MGVARTLRVSSYESPSIHLPGWSAGNAPFGTGTARTGAELPQKRRVPCYLGNVKLTRFTMLIIYTMYY
jgi:hypothetical protein